MFDTQAIESPSSMVCCSGAQSKKVAVVGLVDGGGRHRVTPRADGLSAVERETTKATWNLFGMEA